MLIATTVGALVASRRPRHPVGWLLLGFALSQTATGVIAAYVAYGLVARPGALPAAHIVARYYPATGAAALALLSFVLLLTPTGSLPSPAGAGGRSSPRPPPWPWSWWWRWSPGPVGPPLPGQQSLQRPGLGGVLLVATRVALAVTALAVVVAAGSLVVRFRRARGVERQQLRWVALGAALMGLAAPVVLVPVAVGIPTLVDWVAVVCLVVLPVAVGRGHPALSPL